MRSSPFFIAIALGLLATFVITSCGDKEEPETTIAPKSYEPPKAPDAAITPIPFADVTPQVIKDWQHTTGAFTTAAGKDSRYLPECMGPGVVLFDFDGDSDLDLFVPNGSRFAESSPSPSDPVATSKLFRNNGAFRFSDVTSESGLAIRFHATGGAAADVDNDGDRDLLLLGWGGSRLFLNNDGKFSESTESSGLGLPQWKDDQGNSGPEWSTSAAFFDADRDGDLDVFICHYALWSPRTDLFDSLNGKDKSYATPRKYRGSSCRLFINDGQGHFQDKSESAGVLSTKAKALGLALWDVNQDGFEDIFVANDGEPNFLYLSQGPARYRDAALSAQVAYDEDGRTRAGMGIDAAEYLNDGHLGVPIGNFSGEPVALYRQGTGPRFKDVTQRVGLAGATQSLLTFGLLWADLDHDGRQDLVLANGHLDPQVEELKSGISYRQPVKILKNLGRAFRDISAQGGPGLQVPLVGRGLAAGDIDQDGDLDLVVGSNGEGVRILRNDQVSGNNWLRVKVLPVKPSNDPDALGAQVTVISALGTQRRLLRTGSSYASQSEVVASFGLGADTRIERVVVTWPDGSQRSIEAPRPNQLLTVEPKR